VPGPTFFSYFCQFTAKNWRFTQKPMLLPTFWKKQQYFEQKNPPFFRQIY
jgi:hypothetical protein